MGFLTFLFISPPALLFTFLGSRLRFGRRLALVFAPVVFLLVPPRAHAELEYLRQDFSDAWVDSWRNPDNGDIAANLFEKSSGRWAAYMIIRPCNGWYQCRDFGYLGWRYEVTWYVFGIIEGTDGFQDENVRGLNLLSNAYGLYFIWQAALTAQGEVLGYGPGASTIVTNGCTGVPTLWWKYACDAHDVSYGIGGNRWNRYYADFQLMNDMDRVGGPGKLYFVGVQTFGCHFFNYSFNCSNPYNECGFGYQEWGFPVCALGRRPLPPSCANCP